MSSGTDVFDRKTGGPTWKVEIDNIGVMKATLDKICEDERAAIVLAKGYGKK
jgi:hypothetical protein